MSPAVVVAFLLGALVIGVPSARYAKLQRARSDWRGAAKLHRTARAVFWATLGAFLRAAVGPLLVGAVLFGLYLLGRGQR